MPSFARGRPTPIPSFHGSTPSIAFNPGRARLFHICLPYLACAAWVGVMRLPSLLYLILGGGARLRRPSRERTLNWLVSGVEENRGWLDVPYDLAVDGAGNAVLQLQVHLGDSVIGEDGGVRDITCRDWLVSLFQFQAIVRPRIVHGVFFFMSFSGIPGHVRIAADSTMLRMVKRLMALSLGTQRAQLEQRTGLTWPRPFLLRPLEIVSPLFHHMSAFKLSLPAGLLWRTSGGQGPYLAARFLTILTDCSARKVRD